jgi:hypothetical protein
MAATFFARIFVALFLMSKPPDNQFLYLVASFALCIWNGAMAPTRRRAKNYSYLRICKPAVCLCVFTVNKVKVAWDMDVIA